MALMDKPTNTSTDDTSEMDVAVTLEEGDDVSEENLKYSGVVSYVEGQYQRSKTARLADELSLIHI